MDHVIADTYEIIREIGSGGSGIVCLAKHLRLGKWVVLKADKRSISAKPENLRREVDTLKNLSHTYIPQVYDFIVEDGAVYTVMDFIEGESLDQPLARGERFSQAQVIVWAKQLLEALCYLHSRPPYGILHADIKPANIMLAPDGSIRLIDFNIALFLGEEGAVRVGYSQGYASPEHYGSSSGEDTELVEESGGKKSNRTYASAHRPGGLLDARSDVYSLGATLYHLFSGRRPAKDAGRVQPLTAGDGVSPAVAAIIQKAMSPDPADRYQTAEEMLRAFRRLHQDDPRRKTHRRRVRAAAGVLTLLFLAGGLCTFTGLKRMEEEQEREKIIAETAEQALAAVSASESAYGAGDAPEAVRLARSALELHTSYDARAQNALTEALGVYDLSGGFRPHLLLELPGEAIKAGLSPAGTRAAAIAGGELRVFDTESGEALTALPVTDSALADFVFLSEDVVVYAGEGALRCYDLTAKAELWSGQPATAIAVSADGSTVAAVCRDDTTVTLYDAVNGLVRQTVELQGGALRAMFNDTMADPEDDLFALNADGSMLAVGSYESGVLWTYNLRDRSLDFQVDFQPKTHFEGGFHGPFLVFAACDKAESTFAAVDAEKLVQTGAYSQPMRFHTQVDESGVYFAVGRLLTEIDPGTFAEKELAYGGSYITAAAVDKDNASIVKTEDGQVMAFDADADALNTWDGQEQCSFLAVAGKFVLTASRDAPTLTIRKLEDHSQEQLLSYEPFEHNEARLSSDGSTVMLFRFDSFRILGMDRTVLADVEIPIPAGDQVYDQQFRRDGDGDRLEVTYYSGLVRNYSADDGSVLSESRAEPPDASLSEEFLTDRLRIERPLHGTPVVYDRETGEQLGELEPEDYLTYVTQVGEYVVTEYTPSEANGQGRYGLLLNEDLEVLAKLPGLCDVFEDGRLIFDDGKGNLRQSRIHSTEELLALAGNE